ncbi:hypothetical protein ABPG75_014011 [Micractinium tetrahymenae]
MAATQPELILTAVANSPAIHSTQSSEAIDANSRLELAEREATLQLQKAEAVTMAVRTARAELRRLAGLRRAAEAEAAAAAVATVRAEQDAATLRQQKAAGWRPKVGQSVFVPRLGKRAKVVAVDAASGTLTLQAGLIKIQAAPDEVRQQ